MQHTATHCNTLQHTAWGRAWWLGRCWWYCNASIFTPCNTLWHTTPRQHTAAPCNTLHHTASHCNTLHHTATHCNTLLGVVESRVWCSVLQCLAGWCSVLQGLQCDAVWWNLGLVRCDVNDTLGTVLHYSTLQHTATYCNTRLHTATYCPTLQHIATHCNTLQQTATRRVRKGSVAWAFNDIALRVQGGEDP